MEDINVSVAEATHTQVFAGFWRRFAAYLIDGTIIKIVFMPIALIFLRNSGVWDIIVMSRKMPPGAAEMIGIMDPDYTILLQSLFRKLFYFMLFHWGFHLLYYSIWESSKLQATPGKLATGIKVSNSNGQRISFIRALGRNFCKFFSAAIFMVGYMMAGWTSKKQALHDMICDCVVTKSETVHEPLQTFAYAGFWRRFVAYLLDSILLYIFLSPINFLLMPVALKNPLRILLESMKHPNAPLPDINDLTQLILVSSLAGLITFFYFASWESSRFQATPGKLAIGIKVTDLHGQRISFWRASGRYVGKIISGFTLLIGYMMAGWTKHKQALHDELAHCLVIKSDK